MGTPEPARTSRPPLTDRAGAAGGFRVAERRDPTAAAAAGSSAAPRVAHRGVVVVASRPGWIVGIAVLAVALILLTVAVYTTVQILRDPSARLKGLGSTFGPSSTGPSASFNWTTHGYNVSVTDTSVDNSSTITSWVWKFGDGTTYDGEHPTVHTYAVACPSCTETVSLAVKDAAGASSAASANVRLQSNGRFDGVSGSSSGGKLPTFAGLAAELPAAVEALLLLFLIAASLLRAAWNLLRREEETVGVPIRPRPS